MPRRSSARGGGTQGGRAPTRSVPPRPDRSPQPPPAPRAPSQPPAQQRGGGIMSGVMSGMAMGAGAAAGSRAVDSVLGPRPLQVLHSDESAKQGQQGSGDGCEEEQAALRQCLKDQDPSQCQGEADRLRQCQQRAPTVSGCTDPPGPWG
mmetsp:Transcript_9137/g.22996  ORF Transcript_9137/g.22996 Transcript_9137/m.22996 type:complete len:149 (+) Transcript_9137:42-488(+)